LGWKRGLAITRSLTPPREIAERKAAFPRLFPIARNSLESFLSFKNLSMVDFILQKKRQEKKE